MIKQGYVTVVRVLGRPLRRLGVLRWMDRRTARRSIHWLRSLFAIHDVEEMAALGVPWWSYRAIDEVEQWMADREKIRAFEWGSGASTIWLADRVATVTAVEHHAGFAEWVRELVADRQTDGEVDLHVVTPVEEATPTVPSRKEGHERLDFADYVAAIDRLGGDYDLISIDGRARGACLDRAVSHLAEGGIIVFDNTDRSRYRLAIDDHQELEAHHHKGLTPALPYPTTTTVLRRR
jgi:hypothetical protein